MQTLTFAANNITELKNGDDIFIDDLKGVFKKNIKGGIGTVSIIELDIEQLAKRNFLFDNLIAIKSINNEKEYQKSSQKKFKDELIKWALISHSDVVPLQAIFLDQVGNWYAAMPYYEGTLSHFTRNVLLNHGNLFQIISKITSSLYALSNEGMIHLDLKPNNILVKRNKVSGFLYDERKRDPLDKGISNLDFCVSDFGTSLFVQEIINKKNIGQSSRFSEKRHDFGGTLPYMSPERFSLSYTPHSASDVFSLGIILTEMITGYLPFAGCNATEVVNELITGSYQNNIRILLQGASQDKIIENLVLSMTSFEAEQRPKMDNVHTMYYEYFGKRKKTFFINNFDIKHYLKGEFTVSSCNQANVRKENDEIELNKIDIALNIMPLLYNDFACLKSSGRITNKEEASLHKKLNIHEEMWDSGTRVALFNQIERMFLFLESAKNLGVDLEIPKKRMWEKTNMILDMANSFDQKVEHINITSCHWADRLIPGIVYERPHDFNRLWNAPLSFPIYLYLMSVIQYKRNPMPLFLSHANQFSGYLESDIYYWMFQSPEIDDFTLTDKSLFMSEKELGFSPTQMIGAYCSIVVYSIRHNLFSCLTIKNSINEYLVATSAYWKYINHKNQVEVPNIKTEVPRSEKGKISRENAITILHLVKHELFDAKS
jgi:serine/threonine protein kinase